jgi:hypothetical protein
LYVDPGTEKWPLEARKPSFVGILTLSVKHIKKIHLLLHPKTHHKVHEWKLNFTNKPKI